MQQITSAIQEQLRASEQLLHSHNEARQLCEHLHSSTEQQRSTGAYIRESTGAILEMIRAVQSDTAAHAEASEAVAASVARLLENAQHSGESLPELQQLLGDLHRNATETIAELAHFQAGTR
jgi:DNA repair exonuclease SbcCD ATPase subunit